MCEALDDHEGSVSIGGRIITNFRFAYAIVVNAEEEADILVDRLNTITRPDESDDKQQKWLPKRDQDKRLESVENFTYRESNISNEGSKPEILSRLAQTTAALSRLKIIWRDKNISLASKVS